MATFEHSTSCGCSECGDAIRRELARRGFLRLLAASAAGLALAPLVAPIAALAQSKPGYRAMLLSCIDPRTQAPVAAWMDQSAPASHIMALTGRYSQFSIAGASAAVIAPAFKAWRKAFWDNLAATIELHRIDTLIVVDHGNCGAYGIAYGKDVLKDPAVELKHHRRVTAKLQEEVARRHPKLNYQAHYIHQDTAGAFTQWEVLVRGRVIT